MPFRDHFRPPVSKHSSWEGLHGLWPGVIVLQLATKLPDGFRAEPRVHLGNYYEIDVCTSEEYGEAELVAESIQAPTAGTATVTQAPLTPTLTVDAEFPEQYAYEVLIFDLNRERRLVAAVEMVSPANKDRPESRQLFAAKCFNLLLQDVCVSIVDVVMICKFNSYAELLGLLNRRDPMLGSVPPPTYAVTCRKRHADRQKILDSWFHPLAIGQPLPPLPIWLSETQSVTIDLESSYEQTCRGLRIP